MTPEAASYLEKARQCLSNARANLGINLSNDAGRNAYLASFHAAQGLIFERTGKAAKTHQGVQVEFNRLGKNDPRSVKAQKLIHPRFLCCGCARLVSRCCGIGFQDLVGHPKGTVAQSKKSA